MKKSRNGFTLIELMISLSVMIIVLTIAIPSFNSIVQNNRATTITNSLSSALNLARSEAIKRGVPVSVCAASNQDFTACGNSWENGWMVFVNPDKNNVFANDANEILLRAEQALATNSNIATNPTANIATYEDTGFAAAGTGNLSFTIKPSGCTSSQGRLITISNTGRISISNTDC